MDPIKVQFFPLFDRSSRGTVVSIETRLRAGRAVAQIPERAKYSDRHWGPLSLLFSRYWRLFPGIKWQARDVDHSSPFGVEVKNWWIYTSSPPYALMVWTVTTLYFLLHMGVKLGHSPQESHIDKAWGQNLQGIILESKRKTVTGDGGNYIIRSFIIDSVHQILLGSSVWGRYGNGYT